MEPTSPKGKDLDRGSAYALHSGVADNLGSNGEFQITGYASRVRDATARDQAVALASYETEERLILFELSVIEALSTVYRGDDSIRTRWKAPAA